VSRWKICEQINMVTTSKLKSRTKIKALKKANIPIVEVHERVLII
jgi:hypothetical protein